MHSVNAVFLLGEAALNSLVKQRILNLVIREKKRQRKLMNVFMVSLSAEVPVVPGRLLLPLDRALRRLPVDRPRSYADVVGFACSFCLINLM